MQLSKVEALAQLIPPPWVPAMLLVNVQFFKVREEEYLQYIPPPPLSAVLFVNMQFSKVEALAQ
jgi:hypothetical protein